MVSIIVIDSWLILLPTLFAIKGGCMNSFNAYYTRKSINEDGDIELIFTVKDYYSIEICKELEKNTLYRLKTSEVKSKRTIQQNKFMWSIIHEIACVDNGGLVTSDSEFDVYIEALERANAKFEYIRIKPEAIPLLKEHFRAVKELNRFTTEKGVEMAQCKVFYGSSKMDIKEMATLLDTVIDMAYEREIPVMEYRYE